jgi:hypothetical protein
MNEVQWIEIQVTVPYGYQAEGYDFVEPMGLYLNDDNQAVRNLTGYKSRRKYVTLRLIEQLATPVARRPFSVVGF